MVKGEALLFLAGQFFFKKPLKNFLYSFPFAIAKESNVLINSILFPQEALLQINGTQLFHELISLILPQPI